MLTLVSWNCSWEKGGFSNKKIEYINQYKPNILIVQECKYIECVEVDDSLFPHSTWYGDGKDSRLGIGIFSKEEYEFKLIPEFKYDASFRYVVPYSCIINGIKIVLFAVWTKNAIDKKLHRLAYVRNIQEAVRFYKDRNVLKNNTIIIGDFNSANKPDEERQVHVDLVNQLKGYGIHNPIPEEHKKDSTFFMQFDEQDSYTNDYCFASGGVKITDVKVGKPCLELSDHCPLIVTLDY